MPPVLSVLCFRPLFPSCTVSSPFSSLLRPSAPQPKPLRESRPLRLVFVPAPVPAHPGCPRAARLSVRVPMTRFSPPRFSFAPSLRLCLLSARRLSASGPLPPLQLPPAPCPSALHHLSVLPDHFPALHRPPSLVRLFAATCSLLSARFLAPCPPLRRWRPCKPGKLRVDAPPAPLRRVKAGSVSPRAAVRHFGTFRASRQ